MTSTNTVSAQFERMYPRSFVEAFNQVEFSVVVDQTSSARIDDIASKYIGNSINRDMSKLKVERESLLFHLKTPHWYVGLNATGKWLVMLMVMVIIILLFNADKVATIWSTIWGHVR